MLHGGQKYLHTESYITWLGLVSIQLENELGCVHCSVQSSVNAILGFPGSRQPCSSLQDLCGQEWSNFV